MPPMESTRRFPLGSPQRNHNWTATNPHTRSPISIGLAPMGSQLSSYQTRHHKRGISFGFVPKGSQLAGSWALIANQSLLPPGRARRRAGSRVGGHSLVACQLFAPSGRARWKRGGMRLPVVGTLPTGDYYAIISRAKRRSKCEVYA